LPSSTKQIDAHFLPPPVGCSLMQHFPHHRFPGPSEASFEFSFIDVPHLHRLSSFVFTTLVLPVSWCSPVDRLLRLILIPQLETTRSGPVAPCQRLVNTPPA
jgi:hypothetical protein